MSIVTNNLKVREIINQVINDPEYRAVASVPLISAHQIGLLFLTFALVFGGIYLASIGTSLWIVYPFQIFGFYTSFTIIHDATHRSVSSSKFFNDFLGTVASNLLFPFMTTPVYRYFHLSHHRYVGDEHLDPDEAMVGIPAKYFPFGYLSLFFQDFIMFHWLFKKVWTRTPANLRMKIAITGFINIAFHTAMFMSPFGMEYLFYFFIPSRLGLALTAYLFAHLPHPEGVHWDNHPFQATYQVKGNFILLASLWGQAHHSMHHFLPHVPWYKYHKIMNLANGVFKKQNIPERKVFSKPELNFKDRIIKQDLSDDGRRLLKATVTSVKAVAEGVCSFTFEPLKGNDFPTFSVGSHIHIYLPSGKVRSYSLVNPTYEKNKYQIAVKLEENGKGGSKEMHEVVSVGSSITISTPKNNFVLYENIQKYILIAGGIGITPLISMAHRLTALGKHFEFHICARNEENIPFQKELLNWSFAPNVELHLDQDGKSSMELPKILAKPDNNTLVYVCGPTGFNRWVKEVGRAQGWTKDQIREELFSADALNLAEPKPFEVVLNKSGQLITVKKEESIIDALLLNNIKVDYTCLQGTCGTCITKVVDGEIDHRDAVLTEEEKLACSKICLCVSRAKHDKIVLDL